MTNCRGYFLFSKEYSIRYFNYVYKTQILTLQFFQNFKTSKKWKFLGVFITFLSTNMWQIFELICTKQFFANIWINEHGYMWISAIFEWNPRWRLSSRLKCHSYNYKYDQYWPYLPYLHILSTFYKWNV